MMIMSNRSKNATMQNWSYKIKEVALTIHRDRRTAIALLIIAVIGLLALYGYKITHSSIQEISNWLQGLADFLINVLSDIVAILIVVMAYSVFILHSSIFSERRSWISQINREAYSMLYNNMKKPDILAKLRTINFGFLNEDPNEDNIAKKNRAFVRYVLANDNLMYDYVISSVFNRKTFKALEKEVAEKYLDETKEEADIRISLNTILTDNTQKNREKAEKLIAKWTTAPFICSQISFELSRNEKITCGKNCTYIFKAMMRCNVIDSTATYRDYIICLEKLKALHPDMEIITSQGTITENTPEPGNPIYERLTEIIKTEFLNK